MEGSFLKKIGFKVETRLSTIKRTIPDAEFDTQRDKRSMLPIAALQRSLEELIEPLDREDKSGLPNPFRLGYRYAEQGIDPTIDEIWTAIAGDPQNEGVTRWVGTWMMGTEFNDLQARATTQISTYFEEVAVGCKMFSAIPPLKRKLAIIYRAEDFFNERQTQTKDFDRLIEIVDWLINRGYTLEDTIDHVVRGRKLIESMKTAFEQIKTPNILRTIEDQIKSIKAKIGRDDAISGWMDNPYRDGYYMAIRGEEGLIVDIAEAYYAEGVKGLLGKRVAPTSFDPAGDNLTGRLTSIMEGYAASYHLAYLEARLAPPPKPMLATDDSLPTPTTIPKLKWKGQKNQLYDILRQLKEKDLLGNSYDDLAVFLKANVDAFKDTELSTIAKQIARPQNLPKSRRMKLDEK